jgi:hypothetical protein
LLGGWSAGQDSAAGRLVNLSDLIPIIAIVTMATVGTGTRYG